MDVVAIRQKAISKYLETGHVLVKLRPNSKVPLEKNWVRLPFRSKFSTVGNYGVVLQHNQLIIDVDPRNFKNKENSLTKLEGKIGKLPKTFVVKTGAGGFHYYFTKPPEYVITNKLDEYPGIEFKTKGGQIVGPGSIHPDTKKMYTPHEGTKLNNIVEAPTELLNLIIQKHSKTGSPKQWQASYTEDEASISRYLHYLKNTSGAVEGQGGDVYTYTIAAYGKDLGLTPKTVFEMLMENWNSKCTPPWGSRDLKEKVRNAFSYGVNEVGCSSYANIFGIDETAAVPIISMNKEGAVVANFVNAYYFIGSPKVQYIGAGQQKMQVQDNPLGGIIRYNELTNMLEFGSPAPWHKQKSLNDLMWKVIGVTDVEILNVKYYLDNFTGLCWNKLYVQDAVIKAAHDNRYNPVTVWLESLEWDGEERLDTWLYEYCGTRNTRYTTTVGAKTLLAAVARSYHPGIKFDHMLILEGEQGIGKSTAVNILAGEWYIDIMLRTDSKDTVQLINGAWIIEVSEMAGLRKQEVESLKAFISRPTDSIRPPFGKTPINYPRRSIFIGTVNPTSMGYLNDETGNRRYWPVECKEIKMSALRRDRDQLFAEAVLRYKNGERLYLTDQYIIDQAVDMQEKRSMTHPWFSVIRDYFETYDPDNVTVKDLYLDAINGNLSNFKYTDKAIILSTLRRLGWKQNKSGKFVNPKMFNDIDKLVENL